MINPYVEKDHTEADSEQKSDETADIKDSEQNQDTIYKQSNAAASEKKKTEGQDDNGGIDEE